MSRRHRPTKVPEWLMDHPPANCKKLMAKKTLELLDKIKEGTLTKKEIPVNER